MYTIVGIDKNWLFGASGDMQALKTLATKELLRVPAKMGATSKMDATATALTKYLCEWENTC